ncbi:hypothetical protein E3N88_23033 [Mikania micrantha]|uniref:Leucine-rich repeat-containing N-terminal plant-type domain-containing protein n=1 Tax=Mikania micrantha TaxID=192012 RepID=A0A5N6NC63_9ASTR|nr:hypothetical protein E3N88_23033 [Mikania micrantha]
MFGWAHQGISIKENEIKALLERKALLEIKASLVEVSKYYNNLLLLPSWVVDNGSNYCDWERINCNSTSSFVDDNYKYVTDLSLGGMLFIDDNDYDFYFEIGRHRSTMWPLNISIFLNFKELRRLDLSWNYIGNTFVTSGLERLSGLKKLENLNLNNNFIETNNIFPLLSQLTSLKVLDLNISEFRIPENMEVLDLTGCGFYGTLRSQEASFFSSLLVYKALSFLVEGSV